MHSSLLILTVLLTLLTAAHAEVPSVRAKKVLERLEAQRSRNAWTFSTGYHPVLDRETSEVTGLVEPDGWEEKATYLNAAPVRALPARFDWREQGGLTPVKNQRNCGSCWAFGTVAVLENLLKIRDNLAADLSEQQLVSCNNDGYSCGGGWFAHEYHLSPGATSGAQFPYVASDVSCKTSVSYGAKIQDWAYVGSQGRAPTTDEIKNAIATYGPVAVTVAASGSFQAYQSGVYNACDSASINHMVNLVGWDDAGGYWIMRNSWGADWGEDGYMRIKYKCNRIGSTTSFAVYKPACAPQPIAYAGEEVTTAPGQLIILGGMAIPGQTYQWTPETGLDNPRLAMPVAKPLTSTTYTVKVTNGCGSAEKSVRVLVSTK